jgi:dolichyl-phosphate-mannose--protein O-mannosyl transferase
MSLLTRPTSLTLAFDANVALKGWTLLDVRGGSEVLVTCAGGAVVGPDGANPNRWQSVPHEYRRWHHQDFMQPCASPVTVDVHTVDESSVGELALYDAHGAIVAPERICDNLTGACGPASSSPLFDEGQLARVWPGARDETYFDEIYYARTAREIIEGRRIYETTHPPFGKDLMAAAVVLLGDAPFAWRLPSALAGAMLPVLLLALSALLFRRRLPAYLAAGLCLLDPMPLALERMATVDAIVATLLLATYVCLLKATGIADQPRTEGSDRRWLVGGAVLWGAAAATKWVALYAAPMIGLMILATSGLRPRTLADLMLLGFVAMAAYATTYVPLVATGSLEDGLWGILRNQYDMWSYHTSIVGEHPYSTRFYEWPLVQRPLLLYQDLSGGGLRRVIIVAGNVALHWSIPIAAAIALASSELRRQRSVQWLGLAMAAQMLPWMMVSRSTFIYHFLPVSLLGIALIAHLLARHWERQRAAVSGYVALVALVAVAMYPLAMGWTVSDAWVQGVRIFDTWVF